MPKRSPAAGNPASPQSSPSLHHTTTTAKSGGLGAIKRKPRGPIATSEKTGHSPEDAGNKPVSPPVPPSVTPSVTMGKIEQLLNIESSYRNATSINELSLLAVNETRELIGYNQALVLQANDKGRYRVIAVSSLGVVDRNAPFIRWMEFIIDHMGERSELDQLKSFDVNTTGYNVAFDEERVGFPFTKGLWVPCVDDKAKSFCGVLYLRSERWSDQDESIPMRLSQTMAHAWQALTGASRIRRKVFPKRSIMLAAAIFLVAQIIPVPMTVLAPAEIVAKHPQRIAAPIDGVIDDILVEPNTLVAKGERLFRYIDTNLRSEFELSQKRLQVAATRLRRANQAAFSDNRMKAEIAIARSEVELAKSERDFAKERLTFVEQVAPTAGLVIYQDKDEWTGRPVSTGERIMDIADPSSVKVRLDLAVDDAIALKEGASVRLFLDANPLNSLRGVVETASYHATPTSSQVLAYRVSVALDDEEGAAPRIGLQGTAQLYGDYVPLAFFLFRRPLSTIRQYLGL